MSMNQKNIVMAVSGIVAAVTSLVFTGSAMGLLGVKKSADITLDPQVAGAAPTAPKKKGDANKKTEQSEDNEQTVETNL